MLTRAYIEEVKNDGTVKIRIPLMDGKEGDLDAVPNDILSEAAVLCQPGIDIDFKKNDVVVVGFEDNELNRPIILGYLHLKGGRTPTNRLHCNFSEVNIQDSLTAPTKSKIGNISYSDLFSIRDKVDDLTKSN